MSKKQTPKKKSQPASNSMTSHKYETPQDYIGSEEYQTNQPIIRANRIEEALNFIRELVPQHGLKLKSDGIMGEKVLIVIDGQGNPNEKLKKALLKEYNASVYSTVKVDIRWG